MENKITNAKSEQTLQCITPGCTYHVHYIPKPPLPGFSEVSPVSDHTKKTVYLRCDNPETPHTNAYQIEF